MVISAETPTRPPDPAAESTAVAVAAAGATAPRGEAKGSLLHNFTFPILKTWGSHRVLRCMSVNGKGEVVAGGGRRSDVPPEPAGPRIREEVESEDGDDPGIEEVREKLLVHLREAADRMKLAVPSLPKDAGRKAQPAPAQQERLDPEVGISPAPPARPWNLRTRRGATRAPTGVERHLSGSPPGQVVKRTVRRRSEDPWWRERPKFSISLTREEIEEDIYAVTGRRARQRPRKRARVVQKQLDALFPGSWLTEITADTYRVPDSRWKHSAAAAARCDVGSTMAVGSGAAVALIR